MNGVLRCVLCFALLTAGFATPVGADENWSVLARDTHARLVTQPTSARLHNLYGYYQFRAGATEAAVQAFRTAIRLDPSYTTAWNNLGAALLRLGRYAEAEACFRKVLRLDPHYAKARYNLAVARFRQGYYREALEIYLALRKDDPAYTEQRTDRLKAERELDAALARDPGDPVLREVKRRYEAFATQPTTARP